MNIIEKYYVYDEKGEFFFKNFRLFDGRFLLLKKFAEIISLID